MPIFDRSPPDLTGACVNAVNEETGEYYLRWIQPEDVLAGMARGKTASEIAEMLNTPITLIEHAIAQVPMMMAWREQEAHRRRHPEESEPEKYLPTLPKKKELE